MKISPVAKYLTENKVKPYKDRWRNELQFINKEEQILGILKKKLDMFDNTHINIDLYKPKEDTPFLNQEIVITRYGKYFYDKDKLKIKAIPTTIQMEKYLNDYEHNINKSDIITRGLTPDLSIERIPESEQGEYSLIATVRELCFVPNGHPIYRINKPFKYEIKEHKDKPARPIDSTKPMLKE